MYVLYYSYFVSFLQLFVIVELCTMYHSCSLGLFLFFMAKCFDPEAQFYI